MEELDYNVLYRWFVGLSLDDPIWDATTFTKNRNRLLDGDVADAFFAEVLAATGRRAALGRALHRGRHVARGLGEPQEFQTHGPRRDAAGRSEESVGEFPRGAALIRRITRRPIPTPPLQESRRARSQTGLSRRSAHGEPARSGGRHHRHAGDRDGRTRRRDRLVASCPDHGSPSAPTKATTRAAGSPRCGTHVTPHVALKRSVAPSIDGPCVTPATRQPTGAETDRRSLRLDENRRRAPQAPSSRRGPRQLAVYLRRGGLEPGPDAYAGGDEPDPRRIGQSRARRSAEGRRLESTTEVAINARISASC